ncbi:hypothetical protein ALQ62_200100 [Pseudomonas coronafaciens pv. zizaniae]|nr:hypothetical protein ALQ62_200100 [Pseudomonas coronafaciens pv. zizaniae]
MPGHVGRDAFKVVGGTLYVGLDVFQLLNLHGCSPLGRIRAH